MFSRIVLLSTLLTFVGMVLEVTAQTREEKVREDRRKVEAEGFWIYNDLPQALRPPTRTASRSWWCCGASRAKSV